MDEVWNREGVKWMLMEQDSAAEVPADASPQSPARMLDLIVRAQFDELLSSCLRLGWGSGAAETPQELLEALQRGLEGGSQGEAESVFLLGVGCLLAFMQQNFTGPSLAPYAQKVSTFLPASHAQPSAAVLPPGPPPKCAEEPLLVGKGMEAWARARLEVDGETPPRFLSGLCLLAYARHVLVGHREALERRGFLFSGWWAARCLFAHQRTLNEPSNSLKEAAFVLFDQLLGGGEGEGETQLHGVERATLAEKPKLQALLRIEKGCFHHSLFESREALALFLEAQQGVQLSVTLTGVLGVRTRFQTFKVAQLTVDVTASTSSQISSSTISSSTISSSTISSSTISSSSTTSSSSSIIRRDIALNDDTLLEKPKLDQQQGTLDGTQKKTLEPIEQALLLALCLNVKNQNPEHGLTKEEMMAYVSKVFENPTNWLIHSECLLIRSQLESDSSRKIERAALQMTSLVEQYHDTDPSAAERLRYVFATAYPNYVHLQKELGTLELSLGIAASALQVFERLEMWEQVVMCYRIQGKLKRAEKMLRERVSLDPTPELWVMLGELTNNEQCFERAWEISGHRYARAQRFWGRMLLRAEKWRDAMFHFQLALQINPLFPDILFSLGCAALQVKEWQTARDALSRMVAMHSDDGEAWNNLANCYVQLKEPMQAFHCYEQALKHKRESWKIWQNYLYVSMQTGQVRYAIDAIHEMIELKAAREVPIKVLHLILSKVEASRAPPAAADGSSSSEAAAAASSSSSSEGSLCSKFRELLGHYRAFADACTADIWRLHSQFYMLLSNTEEALEYLNRENRARQAANWRDDPLAFAELVLCQESLVNLHLRLGDPKNLYSAALQLRRLIKQSEDVYIASPEFARIQTLLNQVESIQ